VDGRKNEAGSRQAQTVAQRNSKIGIGAADAVECRRADMGESVTEPGLGQSMAMGRVREETGEDDEQGTGYSAAGDPSTVGHVRGRPLVVLTRMERE
jgi:hypothetical protein